MQIKHILTASRIISLAMLAGVLLCALTCVTTHPLYVVTGEVSRLAGTSLSTAVVTVGKAQISTNPQFPRTPDPGDTTSLASLLPNWLSAVSGAKVLIDSTQLAERSPGVYFAILSKAPVSNSNLSIDANPSDPIITGHAVVPDTFTITRPGLAETLHRGSLSVNWTRSDSAQNYIVNVAPVGTGITAKGFSTLTRDTFCEVPADAFADKATGRQTLSGPYLLSVWAINGGWNRDLASLVEGGLVQNGLGVFGAATVAIPALVVILPDSI